MELSDFLDAVITADVEPDASGALGFFQLGTIRAGSSVFYEQWYRWPVEKPLILKAIEEARGNNNIYFSTYLFKGPSSIRQNVLPTRTIQADLDDADITALPIEPSILIRTSPKRHQALWILDTTQSVEAHEVLSRKLTYAIPKCDHSGWPVGRKIRIPDTFNFKYAGEPRPVEILSAKMHEVSSTMFELLPEPTLPPSAAVDGDNKFLSDVETLKLDVGPQELLLKYRDKGLSPKVYVQYNNPATDRSRALWALMLGLVRCGATREEVFWLSLHSKNNKFDDLRSGAKRELAKDVLRAEDLIKRGGDDPREQLNQARGLTPSIVRKQTMLRMIIAFMKERGAFLHTMDENVWYAPSEVGRPIRLSDRSRYLNVLMDSAYGLNAAEGEHAYVVAGIANYALSLPDKAMQTNLSWFDQANKVLYLHSGRREVFRITPTKIDIVPNGTDNIVFPWKPSVEPFVLGNPDSDWAERLFGHSSTNDALANLIGLSRSAALAVLKAWMVFLLFRNISPSRPLLATFGQPGSGKSVLFKKVYRLLYGRHRAVSGVSNPEEFDQGASQYPLLVLDNADQWERWLPDRLAQSAGDLEVTRRMLYTDGDEYLLRRSAMIGITAHNPRFAREDVADRLLLLTFERLAEEARLPEQSILDEISEHRADIWAGIVQDVQKIMVNPVPIKGPNFRIEDFARLGQWITDATGDSTAFKDALVQIRYGQRSFSLEEDAMLVGALKKLMERYPEGLTNKSPGQLWGMLEATSGADRQAFAISYKNSTALGKKLLALQDALKLVFEVEWEYNSQIGVRLWSIKTRSENGHA